MAQTMRKPVIDFTSYIIEWADHFTGREWVFQAIDTWLADPHGERFFLLKGEPGSGKTAISARLSQFAKGTVSPPNGLAHLTSNCLSALHFCSTRDSRRIHPRVFAESLAMQLAERYPAYAKALAEKSGDRSIRIEVQQHTEQGDAVGVIVNKLDVGGTSPEDAFNRVVRAPLEALVAEELDRQVIILVDALDEALSSSLEPNIVSLLSQTDDLPSQVRFILTTRQESRVEKEFHNVRCLSISTPNDQRNQIDIGRYVQGRLEFDLELIAKAKQVEFEQIAELVEVVPPKAEGNFLYARFLLDAMAKGLRPLTELNGLPTGLDDLYFDSLNRVVKLGKRDWFTTYRPLMGVLSVVQESLTIAQLQAFTAQPESSIWQYRSDLQQFIQETSPGDGQAEQETRYRLYHQSFIDFLGRQRIFREQRQLTNDYYIPPDEWHRQIIDLCEQGGIAAVWQDAKGKPVEQGRRDYARRYYITHLYQAHAWDRLFHLVDEGTYGRAKLQYDPSANSFIRDLELAQRAAAWEGWTPEESLEYLPHLWRYTLLRCSLTNRVDAYPDAAFELLLLIDRHEEARRSAELLTDAAHRARVFLLMANILTAQPERRTEGLQLFERAYGSIQFISDGTERTGALKALGRALVQVNDWQMAQKVASSIEDSAERTEALKELGQALVQDDHWQEAQDVIGSIEDKAERIKVLRELSLTLAQRNRWQEALYVVISIEDSAEKALALNRLGEALAEANYEQDAIQIWEMTREVISSVADNKQKVQALKEFIQVLAKTRYGNETRKVWQDIQEIIAGIEDSAQQEVLYELSAALIQVNEISMALQVAPSIQNPILAIQVLCEVGQKMTELGQTLANLGHEQEAAQAREGATSMWQHIQETISALGDSSPGKVMILNVFGQALAKVNREQEASLVWQEAREALASTEASFWRSVALSGLADALARASHGQEAWEVLASIEDSEERTRELNKLGKVLIETNQWKLAWEVLASTEHGGVLIKANQWELDMDLLVPTEDRLEKSEAWRDLCLALALANQWQEARKVIASINKEKKDWVLRQLSLALIEANQWQEAQEVLASITIPDQHDFDKVELLEALGKALTQSNQWQQAEGVIAIAISKGGYGIDKALSEFSQVLAQANQWQQAREAIASIEDRFEKTTAVRGLILALAQTDHWQEAREVIASIDSFSFHKDEALGEFGLALARSNHWQEAREIMTSIKDYHGGALALSEFGKVLAQAHYKHEAILVWQEVQESIASWNTGSFERKEALVGLSQCLAFAEHWQEAREVIASFEDDRYRKYQALSSLSQAFAQAKCWQEAQEIIPSILVSSEKDRALSALSQAFAQVGRRQEAREALASIENSFEKARALIVLGQVLVQAEHEQEAAQAWQEALETITSNKDGNEKVKTLHELYQALMQTHQWQLTGEAMAFIEPSFERAKALNTLGLELAQANQEQEAKVVWQKAQEATASITNSDEKVKALSLLSQTLARANYKQEAALIWQETRKAIASFKYLSSRTNALKVLGQALIETNYWQLAEEVIISIEESDEQAMALSKLGQMMALANHEQGAKVVWRQVQNLITSFTGSEKKAKALSILGQTLALANHEQEAALVWQEAQGVIASFANLPSTHPSAYHFLEKLPENPEQESLESTPSIEDNTKKVQALSELGQAMALANHEQEAKVVWQQAQEVIATIENGTEKVKAMNALGQTMTQANHEQEAKVVWKQAHKFVADTDLRIAKVFGASYQAQEGQEADAFLADFLKAARALRELGQQMAEEYHSLEEQEKFLFEGVMLDAVTSSFIGKERDEKSIREAGKWMLRIASNSVSAKVLSELGKSLARAHLWQEAQDVIAAIEKEHWKDSPLVWLGYELIEANQWQQARKVIASFKDSSDKDRMLIKLVEALIQAHQWQLAEEVIREERILEKKRSTLLNELGQALRSSWSYEQKTSTTFPSSIFHPGEAAPEQAASYQQLQDFLRQVWLRQTISDEALSAFSLAHGLVLLKPSLGVALCKAFIWVDTFMNEESAS